MTTDHSPQADHRPLCVSPISPPLARSRPNGTPRIEPRQVAVPELLNCACGGEVSGACNNCGVPREIFLVRAERLLDDLRRDPYVERARMLTACGLVLVGLGAVLWIALPEVAVVACVPVLVVGAMQVGAGIVSRMARVRS